MYQIKLVSTHRQYMPTLHTWNGALELDDELNNIPLPPSAGNNR